MSKLFSEIKLKSNNIISNRLAVAPMTTTQSNADGTVSEQESQWLERLAQDEYGLIITCAASISPTSIAFPNQLSIANESMMPGLSKLAERLSSYQSKTIVQLCHAGSRTLQHLTGESAHSASSYEMPDIKGFVPPEMLSTEQISGIINDFEQACKRVSDAGFDGVEFHGANGYLFTQFFSKMTNLRNDNFGGSLQNRARFAREVVKACKKAVPDNFILGFRMSFENAGLETGLDIDENIEIVNWLAEDGIDYIHISHLFYDAKSVKYPNETALTYLRKNINTDLPIICAGSIVNVEDAKKALDLGADIIAVGRAAIGNTKLPEYFSKGENLPNKTPYTQENLTKIGISPDFISYLKNAVPLASLNILKKQ